MQKVHCKRNGILYRRLIYIILKVKAYDSCCGFVLIYLKLLQLDIFVLFLDTSILHHFCKNK